MKTRKPFIIAFLCLCSFILLSCNQTEIVSSNTQNDVITKGLEKENLDTSDVLYTKSIENEDLVFFVNKDKAISFASVIESDGIWEWKRLGPYYGFEDTSTNFNDQLITIQSRKNESLYIIVGKIFNDTIESIVFWRDESHSEEALLVNTYFFTSISQEKAETYSIKAYDINGKEIER